MIRIHALFAIMKVVWTIATTEFEIVWFLTRLEVSINIHVQLFDKNVCLPFQAEVFISKVAVLFSL